MRRENLLYMSLLSRMSSECLLGAFLKYNISMISEYIYFSFLFHDKFNFFDRRYLREDKPHGSAGCLYSFRDYIMEENPVCI